MPQQVYAILRESCSDGKLKVIICQQIWLETRHSKEQDHTDAGAYHHKNYQFWLEWCKPITCCWTPRGSKALEARRHVMGLGMVLTRLDIVLRKYEWKYISAGGFIPGMHFFVIPPAGVFIFSVGQLYFSCAWQLAEMSQLLEVCQLMKCENSGQLAELSKSVVLCASWWIGKVAANWQNWWKTFYSYLQGRSF